MAPNSFLVSHSVEQELTEYSTRFDSAFVTSETPQWSQQLGAFEATDNLATVYPLDIGSNGYRPFKGDMKYRDMYAAELRMRQDPWQDGVSVVADRIRSKDWVGWGKAPERMARAARQVGNKLIATLLNANPLLDFYTIRREGGNTASTINWFHAAHPVNLYDSSKGTFGNTFTWTTLDETLADAMKDRFAAIVGFDGESLDLECRTLLVPRALGPSFRRFYADDMLIQAIENQAGTENVGGVVRSNRHKGTVQIVEAPQLDAYSTTTFYAIDELSPVAPWILQQGTTPEMIVHDESSEMYKRELKVAVSSILRAGAAAAFPHAIHRYVYSAP